MTRVLVINLDTGATETVEVNDLGTLILGGDPAPEAVRAPPPVDTHDLAVSMGRLGGLAKLAKYGPDAYALMGKKGGATTKTKRGADYYRAIGAKGHAARRKKKEQDAERSKTDA